MSKKAASTCFIYIYLSSAVEALSCFHAARIKKASLLGWLDIKILIIENDNKWGCWKMPIWCTYKAENENYSLGHIQKHCVYLAMLFKNQLEQIQDVTSCLVVVRIVILDQYFRLSLRFDTHTLNKLTFCILLITQYIVYILNSTTRYFSINFWCRIYLFMFISNHLS